MLSRLSGSGYQPPLDLDSELEGKSVQKELLVASELPVWYEHYTYVQTGYREPQPFLSALRTVFTWHNETLCIHTHLWPGFIIAGFLLSVMQQDFFLSGTAALRFLFVFGYTAAAFCCLCSAFTHTFQIVDAGWFAFLWRLDQVGILGISAGHLFLDIFAVCIAILRNGALFWSVVSVVLLCSAVVAYRVMTVPGAGIFWGSVYPLATSTVLTVPLTIYVFGFSPSLAAAGVNVAELRLATLFSALCSLSVVVGAAFFVGKAPEVCLPHARMLDFFHSHVFFHVLVLAAIYFAITGSIHLAAI